MSRKFNVKVVPSSWLEHNGRRLDCGPYMSGAVEAKELLSKHITEPLKDLTSGHSGGIFNGLRFPRIYVEDMAHGVPFLGSTDILNADLSSLSFLSKKQVANNPALVLDEGWTLITCSGTIGRMAYARSDMKGMAGSQHFMRVAPDTGKINSGYLYAFLSSRFGVPIVVSGTYGAIIQHIEPHHIADLPVPRLGEIEQQAHALVEEAAAKRVVASKAVADGITLLYRSAGLRKLGNTKHDGIPLGFSAVSSTSILQRMDGGFHSPFHQEAVEALSDASVPMTNVSAMSQSIFEPKRFKRVHIDDPEYGVPFFGTTALMWAEPQPSFLIPKSMAGIDELIVDQQTILVPRSGQLSGIIGTAVFPFGGLIGGAVSEHAIRIKCRDTNTAGYLFVALRSEYGWRQLKSRAFGSSIPSLDIVQVGDVIIPDLNGDTFEQIGLMGVRSADLRNQAISLENEARSLVERTIEEGGR